MTLPRHYRRFPGTHLPPDLPGVEVLRPDSDPGPAGKVLNPASKVRGQNCNLLYCDDDWIYDPDWSAGFLAAARSRPDRDVICASGYDIHRLGLTSGTKKPRGEGTASGCVDIAQGFAGVLLRPDWLDETIFEPPREAWPVDDIWLSANFERLGLKIWKAAGLRALATGVEDPGNLQDAKIGGLDRNLANRQAAQLCADRFGIWGRTGQAADTC